MLATHVARDEGLWDGGGQDCRATLEAMGLPADRAAWRRLTLFRRPGSPPADDLAADDVRADDLLVLEAVEAIRLRPELYFGAGGDELGPAIVDWLVRSYEPDSVEASAEVVADDTFVLAVSGLDMSMDAISHAAGGGALGRLGPTSAMCSQVSVTFVKDGTRLTRRFAYGVALGPVEDAGSTGEPDGYRIEFVLDRAVVPAGIRRGAEAGAPLRGLEE
jgi:hypothetical protein